jgi:hypothetical protein
VALSDLPARVPEARRSSRARPDPRCVVGPHSSPVYTEPYCPSQVYGEEHPDLVFAPTGTPIAVSAAGRQGTYRRPSRAPRPCANDSYLKQSHRRDLVQRDRIRNA